MMEDTTIATNAGAMGLSASPKFAYVTFLLQLASKYFEVLSSSKSEDVDVRSATRALIAFCPNRKKREELWMMFEQQAAEFEDQVSLPSARVVGELMSYLSSTLELEEESNFSWM